MLFHPSRQCFGDSWLSAALGRAQACLRAPIPGSECARRRFLRVWEKTDLCPGLLVVLLLSPYRTALTEYPKGIRA
jgi:hypothetical protein